VFSIVDAILAYLGSVFISGRNFGLFALEKCSVFNSGRNFGLFALEFCSVWQFWPICTRNV
jgi:hypothetical protein